MVRSISVPIAGRVPKPEVAPKVDHDDVSFGEGDTDLGGGAMGKGQESDIDLGDSIGVRRTQYALSP
jgi:hypothetical protein